MELAGEGGDGLAAAPAGHEEEGIDELLRERRVSATRRAERLAPAQAAGALPRGR